MNRFNINKRGFWETDSNIGHVHDSNLCNQLVVFLTKNNVKSLVDFGCGMGDYIYTIKKSGIYCEGYDGNPNTNRLTNGLGDVLDLSLTFELDKKFDCVLSLEVGEHIPRYYEQVFINNLCNHTKNWLILSWAIVGQGGIGHFNERPNDYIISEIENRGFIYEKEASLMLRNTATCAPWFKDTILVFKKK